MREEIAVFRYAESTGLPEQDYWEDVQDIADLFKKGPKALRMILVHPMTLTFKHDCMNFEYPGTRTDTGEDLMFLILSEFAVTGRLSVAGVKAKMDEYMDPVGARTGRVIDPRKMFEHVIQAVRSGGADAES